MITIPTTVTIFRILLVPIFIVAYLYSWQYQYELAALLFLIASASDWLDGFLARKLKQTTRFGAFLDPIADKILVLSALILLAVSHQNHAMTFVAILTISREIIVSALRQWTAEINCHGVVAVSDLAKHKTYLQMVSLIVLLLLPPEQVQPFIFTWDSTYIMSNIGYTLVYLSTILSIWTMFGYMRLTLPYLQR